MKQLAIAAFLCLAAACAPRLEPSGPAVQPPRLLNDRIVQADGAALPLRRWLPAGTPRAVIVALHGMNDYSRAFEKPGAYWAEHGIATYAFDQRGFGGAPHRGIWAGHDTRMRRRRSPWPAYATPIRRFSSSGKAWAAPSR